MRNAVPQKILIVRFSSIGDIVLTFSVVSTIKSLFPHCQIDFVTKKQFAALLQACPELDRVFLLNDSLSELRKQIDFKEYDAVLDLHHNLRTRLLLLGSSAPVYRFPKNNIEKWLLTTFKVFPKKRIHVVERYLQPLHRLLADFHPFHAASQYYIPQDAHFDIASRFDVAPQTYIAIAIGAQFATKRLPTDLLIELIEQLKHPVVILGGKEDLQTVDLILKSCQQTKVVSAVGAASIHESAWLAKNAKALLTHDTGLMHIAATFEVPIHLIWGNTVKDFGMYPYRLEQENVFHYEVAHLACRPCSKIGYQQCPKGHFSCMRKQDLTQIAAALNV